ncbi:hypothetical protein Franean1_2573 [Parafrankia sp. EAN1pec]|nr:hypothetical protein Franean1_2573 [Frankia sp. EAN1pec]
MDVGDRRRVSAVSRRPRTRPPRHHTGSVPAAPILVQVKNIARPKGHSPRGRRQRQHQRPPLLTVVRGAARTDNGNPCRASGRR